MVAIFSNLEESLTVPVEILGYTEIDGVKMIVDETEQLIIADHVLGKGCIFTAMDINDAPSGLGISIFSFIRDYING